MYVCVCVYVCVMLLLTVGNHFQRIGHNMYVCVFVCVI